MPWIFRHQMYRLVWHHMKHYELHRLDTYLGRGTKYSSKVWHGTNYNTIIWFSTKCDTMFWGWLLFVTLFLGYGTKCINILARNLFKNIAVTTTNADTCAKYNTVAHDHTCAKCNNNWSYPGNDAKCSTVVVTVLLVWSYPGNGAKCVSR